MEDYIVIYAVVPKHIYETILPFINTIDLIDAVYGILGVIISLIYLLFIDKKGFDN